MTEAALSTRIQKMLPGVHWQRIENSVGVGCPDLNGCAAGKEVWLELKINGGAPTRPAQKVWHIRGARAKRKAFRLTYFKDDSVLIEQMGLDCQFTPVASFDFDKLNLSLWWASL